MTASPAPPPGPGVDARGVPVVDPTANVLALVEAAVHRLDDLRLQNLEHLEVVGELRAQYDERLREAESARIDAIRAVDAGAVSRAAEVSATQALTLAEQVRVSAETLRTQVAAAATAQSIALAAAIEPLQKDIADLRRAQYEAQGQRGQVLNARSATGAVIAAVGLGITLVTVIVSLVVFFITRGATP